MKNLTDKWNKKANDLLLGKKIVKVEYMGTEEADNYMWNKRPVTFMLDNDTRVMIQSDDEGNDGGALWIGSKDVEEILPVLGLRDE